MQIDEIKDQNRKIFLSILVYIQMLVNSTNTFVENTQKLSFLRYGSKNRCQKVKTKCILGNTETVRTVLVEALRQNHVVIKAVNSYAVFVNDRVGRYVLGQ